MYKYFETLISFLSLFISVMDELAGIYEAYQQELEKGHIERRKIYYSTTFLTQVENCCLLLKIHKIYSQF